LLDVSTMRRPGACRRNKILLAAVAVQQGGSIMPKENDLEGQQDQGGKRAAWWPGDAPDDSARPKLHGGQKGMPKPEPRPKTEIPGRDRADVDTPKPMPE
jgi:hypothetical protein